MLYGRLFATPKGLDDLWMESDGEALVGLRFVSPAEAARLRGGGDVPGFREVARWLDCYFAGRDPGFVPAVRFSGLSPFAEAVIQELFGVPFGATVSYGEPAERVARQRPRTSPQNAHIERLYWSFQHVRPHSAIGGIPPTQLLAEALKTMVRRFPRRLHKQPPYHAC